MSRHQLVHVVFRYPYARPESFTAPTVTSAHSRLADQVWQRLSETETSPTDILAELEHDQVTFDWEQLAAVMHVPLDAVFEAASELFRRHMGRPLRLAEEEEEEEGVGMRSVESLGREEEEEGLGSPAVEMSTRTPEEKEEAGEEEEEEEENGDGAVLRMSLAQAMRERHVENEEGSEKAADAPQPQPQPQSQPQSQSSSFSDLSDTSLTSSAMQDALLSEAMNGSTMMGSILGSRMFPWGKR
ncbi:hypothetical protein LPJ53_003632 [Coemansia erecta]|uniref:Autophagy-related protein 29 n=1 Tax=Coemansia erecta TaxID=147472 RepID=A0A9W7XZR0_9FUNG|nr:hypothetical protein LPJ53_003632 [Coemansia erecta]